MYAGRKIFICSLMACIFLSTQNIYAEEVQYLSNIEHFAKCFAKLTDYPADPSSDIYKQVQQGKISAVDACMSVFDTAMFNPANRRLKNPSDPIAKAIVQNFHRFHLSWLTIPYSANVDGAVFSLLDNDEPALYVTDSLFMNRPYKYVVTADKSLRGVRETANPETYVINNINFTNRTLVVGPMKTTAQEPDPLKNYFEIKGPRVSLGPLIGIQNTPSYVYDLPFAHRSEVPISEAQLPSRRLEATTYDINTHAGGGILGSSTTFLNSRESLVMPDGGLYVHRRLSNNFFYDFMCAKLPTFKDSDPLVAAELKRFEKSEIAFRKSATCVACHLTLDNFAHASRNVISNRGIPPNFIRDLQAAGLQVTNFELVNHYTPVKEDLAEPVDKDPLYHRRQPDGRLVYRNYAGKLVNVKVRGIPALGAAVANQEDIYMCAAKRYYNFLTGVSVPLDPITVDPKTKKPADSADNFAFYHRQKIVSLGTSLKKGEDAEGKPWSLRNLVYEIIKSNAFRAKNPAVVGESL